MDLPLVLTGDSDTPKYLQLKYQLTHMISTGRLRQSDRLPPVRSLASAVGANPGTVAQAYRELASEGLIVSEQGRGTFVAPLETRLGDRGDDRIREASLTRRLQSVFQRGIALGFTRDEIRERFVAVLSSSEPERRVAFVAYSKPGAAKYAELLGLYLVAAHVVIAPLTIDELEAGSAAALDALSRVYYVVTFRGLAHRLEQILVEREPAHRVLPIGIEVTHETLRELGTLAPGTRVALVTDKRFVEVVQAMLRRYSLVRPDDVVIVPAAEVGTSEKIAEADVVLHTLGTGPLLDDSEVPEAKRLELHFDVGRASIDSLQRVFGIVRPADSDALSTLSVVE